MWKKMKISHQNKLLIVSFTVFIVFSLIYSWTKPKEIVQENEKLYADTFIPKGFVLIPIELANFDSVSALIDQFGVIDLYAGSPQNSGSVKIASRIKMLRAPQNSQLFAVLVPESESTSIMKNAGPFWAVVQNRQSAELKDSKHTRPIVKIEYQQGG